MNLHQLLSRFSHEQLTQLSEEFGVVSMSPSTRNLLQEVRTKYRDKKFVARLVSDLPEVHRGFLQTLLFFMPSKGQSVEIPDLLLQTWFESEIHPLQLLFDKGLLFKKDEALQHTVIVPDDLYESLSAMLRPKKINLNVKEQEKTEEQRTRLLELVFHLLCFLDRRKAALTQRGHVHRKVLETFQKRYPPAFYTEEEFLFAIEFCRYQHVVVEQGSSLKTSSIVHEWFAQKPFQMLQEVWRFFLSKKVFSNRMFQQFLLFFTTQCVYKNEGNELFAFDEVVHSFVTQINPALPADSELHQTVEQWIHLLGFIGMIDFTTQENRNHFYMTNAGKSIVQFIECDRQESSTDYGMLQPNFDWLVPPAIRYSELWKIDQIAEFLQRDVMTHFRLTQGSILHAMRKGWTQDEVVSFLLEHTQNRIPDNVLYSIQEWCGKYGEIRLRRIVLLECQSQALADELLQIEALQPWLTQRIGNLYFAIEEKEMRPAAIALQELGYEPAVLKPTNATEKL